MSENTNTNDATPITQSAHEPQPGVPVGTNGGWVRVEGCEPLPMTDNGKNVAWAEAGFEVMRRDSDGILDLVKAKDGLTPYVWLRVSDLTKAMRYLGEPRILAALNGNGSKVKQQAVARTYIDWLREQKVQAWEKGPKGETGALLPTYEQIMLQKMWASLAGIALEKRQGGSRVVEKIIEVRVVSLPNGATFKIDPQAKDDEGRPIGPVAQLFSAYADSLTQEPLEMDIDDAVAKTRKMLESGKLHEMLGLTKPEAE